MDLTRDKKIERLNMSFKEWLENIRNGVEKPFRKSDEPKEFNR